MGSDEDHDDMDMRDEWMNDSGEAAAGGRNIHSSLSTSHVGDGGIQITGCQKGVDVVKSVFWSLSKRILTSVLIFNSESHK